MTPFTRLLGTIAVLLSSACTSTLEGKHDSPAPPPIISGYTTERDVVISPEGWPKILLADIYRPVGDGPFPSLLLVHGGAWKGGDRAQVEDLAERIASRGYLVVNSTYRLVPDSIFPAQLRDVQQAIRWMYEQGASHGVDVTRVGGFGYSAGAHLVSLAAGVADDPALGMPHTRLKALVAGGTPSDLTLYKGGRLVPEFIGGSRDEKLETFKAASPITYVRPGYPPVFQYHGTLDNYVPFEQALAFRAALEGAGVPNELFVLHGHGHISAFFADGDAVQASLEFLDRYLR